MFPDIVKGSTPQEQVLAVKLIKEFIESYKLASPIHRSLLYMGVNDDDFLIKEVLPLIPPNITRIVVTKLTEEKVKEATEKYAEYSKRIQFLQLDLGDPDLKIKEEYNCVMSIWNMRWMLQIKDGFPKLMSLVGKFGIACVIFDYDHNFFKAIQYVHSSVKGISPLGEIIYGLPHDFLLKSPRELVGKIFSSFKRSLKKQETLYPVVASNQFETPREMQERLEQQFTAGTYVAAKQLNVNNFYDRVFERMMALERVRLIAKEDNSDEVYEYKMESSHRIVFMKLMTAS